MIVGERGTRPKKKDHIAGWNIPIFKKYIFIPGPFSSQLC